MKINAEREDEAIIARPDGRIDGSNAGEFQAALEAVIEEGDRALILDFASVSYISSVGMRVILLTAKTLQGNGSVLVLCSLAAPIREGVQDKRLRQHHSDSRFSG